jgi:hypothetical protein
MMRIPLLAMAMTVAVPVAAGAQLPDSSPDTAGLQVGISATMVVIDREAVARAGLSHVVLGDGRIRLGATGTGRTPRRARAAITADGIGMQAFLDLAREQRWIRSEFTQQVTVLSGSEGSISSSTLRMGGMGARTTGPSLTVAPTVLPDGSVHLRVSAEVVDVATDRWGYPIDGSPVAARTELVVADGEEAIVASGSATETSRRVGLLHLSNTERDREVLVTITPRVVAAP